MYTVDASRVAEEVAAFANHVRHSWQVFLTEVQADPHLRHETYVDRIIPIPGFPMRTWIYEITEENKHLGAGRLCLQR